MNGFRSCGIVPFNRDAISSEIPWQQRLPVLNRRHHCQHPQMPRRPLCNMHKNHLRSSLPPTIHHFLNQRAKRPLLLSLVKSHLMQFFPLESAASYNAILPLESDASTSMSLDDPDLLLSLINTGEIEVVASAGSPEACEIAPISSSSLNLSKVNETSVESMWNEAVESIFLPPTPAPQKPAKKSKAKTSHRILTATEVIEEKRELLELRKIKEEKARNKKSKK